VSVHIMGLVWKYSRQTGTPLLMLLAVADYADDDGWAFPSVNELARKARLGGKQGRRILHGLLESGELEIHMGEGRRGTAGGTQKTHLYRVVVPDLKVLPQETPPLPRVLPSGVKGTPLQGQGTPIAMGVEPSLEPSVSRTVSESTAQPMRRRPRKSDLALQTAKEFVSQDARNLARYAAEKHGWPQVPFKLRAESQVAQQFLDVGIGAEVLRDVIDRQEKLATLRWLAERIDLRSLEELGDDAKLEESNRRIIERFWPKEPKES